MTSTSFCRRVSGASDDSHGRKRGACRCNGLDVGDALTLLHDEDEEIVAPTLFAAEVCHALSKYVHGGYMEVRDAVDCGRDALSLVDRFVDDGVLWVESLSEAVRLDHSSYDMFYLLLARRECATLFTLDRKLQDLSSRCGVNCVCSIKI